MGKRQGYCSLSFYSILNFSSCGDFNEARADVEQDGPDDPRKMHKGNGSQRSSQFQTQCPEMNGCTWGGSCAVIPILAYFVSRTLSACWRFSVPNWGNRIVELKRW